MTEFFVSAQLINLYYYFCQQDEDEDESKHAAEDDGENVASAVDIAYIEHIARKTGEDKRHDVLTDIYLTNKLRCPIGYERAGAHAPKASHPAYEGDLHEGVRPPLPAEKTEHGCTCARAWIFRPHKSETKPNTQYSGERILSTGGFIFNYFRGDSLLRI